MINAAAVVGVFGPSEILSNFGGAEDACGPVRGP